MLQVVRWILDRLEPEGDALEKICADYASVHWPRLILSLRVPMQVKRELWRRVKAIDAHAMRRLVRPALAAVPLKLGKEYRALRQRFASQGS